MAFRSFVLPVYALLFLLGSLSGAVVLADEPAGQPSTEAAVRFDREVGNYFATHCLDCHGESLQEGNLRIDTLSKNVGLKDTVFWAEIRSRISSGEMPPKDSFELPTAEESARVVEWLTARIEEGEAARHALRQNTSFYRLSREEYVNTVYDLLHVHYDASDPGGFSEDPNWHGFQRIGSVLSLSASHMEKYFSAAETILNEAYPDETPEEIDTLLPSVPLRTIDVPHMERLKAEGLLDKVRYEMWPQDTNSDSCPKKLPADGVYEVTIKLSGLKPPEGRAPRVKVYDKKLDRVLFEQDVVAAEDEPVLITFQTHLPAGRHDIVVVNDVPGPSNLPRSGRHGNKPFISLARGRAPWQLKLTDEQGQPLYPFLILDSVHWKGPIVTEADQQLRKRYFTSHVEDVAELELGLSDFAQRAFRRPLLEGEISKYLAVAQKELDSGASMRSAFKSAMLAVLCSNNMLFLVEGDGETSSDKLNDYELASRLSYMLWSTMPDDELLSLAGKGILHEQHILKDQLSRMLSDERASRFLTAFPAQWLRLDKVGMFPPDKMLYPEYDDHLERSMVKETTAYFQYAFNNELSLDSLLDSDWTMVNNRLADFYGIAGVTGDEFQRVRLAANSPRGGVLTHASVLSLTSDGTRQRPVHRGVWLSEAILGKSPPPPPPNVAALEPNPADSPKATLRMKLDAHKQNAQCAACHAKIDPLGLAFENFNAIGAWRTHEIVQRGTGDNPLVDASGELPDGRKFANADEFKELLKSDIDQFARTFIEKVATYGMRRAMSFDDDKEIDQILELSRNNNYEIKATVEALVLSDLFQQR
ncbi:DUF1592 domain-containing protein [Calycomorphotria hydatis]|uniref:Planctomycete cytochrome C n=1 Tax=Calycomorphotria hydatis TaxID=2528027 RepID=A0A517T932_9PLAN|nr:DUF1592 domain-containing protein [Calycomorphotria hydatis]QDT64894.1 Planctomycete cytochrome C [Calycomorphotria hydatis]